MSDKARPQNYKTMSRRAILEDTSDEKEEVEAVNPSKHLLLKQTQPPSSHDHDQDIDMQLDGVSSERGGSSLRLSVSNDEFIAVPNQAATSRLDNINLADMTPTSTTHKSPRIAATIDTHSAKRRRNEEERHKSPPESNKSHNMRPKEAIPSIDIVSHMWLGFPIHEAIATHKGKDIIREHRTNEEFTRIGIPPHEVIDFTTLRRAFPRVPQMLHPTERPDTVPGNYLHFTQLSRLEKIDHTTGLSEGFQVTIRFDHGFKGIARHDARVACLERLRTMNIPLGTTYANPIDVGLNAITKHWAGFIKLHLQRPQKDGIALLQRNRAFVMTMETGKRVIGKVEKGYELATKARNLRLHLKGDSLRHEHNFDILEAIVRENYYNGKQHEFMGLAKPEIGKNFAFLTLTTEEARDQVLKEGLTFKHEKLQVSVTRDRGASHPSELRISTTLVANNLPQKETQTAIIRAIKQVLGADNVVGVNFGANNHPHTDKQAGWCHIHCLNAAVYTEWLHKSTTILGRHVDFIPHRGSIDGAVPNDTAIRLAHAPAREAIADKIQAMSNVAHSNILVTEKHLLKTMK